MVVLADVFLTLAHPDHTSGLPSLKSNYFVFFEKKKTPYILACLQVDI